MSKFLPIGTKGELLNSDMIARIIPKEAVSYTHLEHQVPRQRNRQ